LMVLVRTLYEGSLGRGVSYPAMLVICHCR
jgi:hypothetical protein